VFEAYAVGVRLSVTNLISPQLALLAKEFEKLDVLTKTFTTSLAKISVDSAGLRSLTTATNATNRAFERANVSAQAFRNHLASINQTGGAIGFAGLAAGRGAPRLPGGGGGGGRGPGGPHGGNIHVGPGGVGLGAAAFAAGDWFWPLAASGAAIYGLKGLYGPAKELNTEQNRFRLFGMTEAQNQEAFKFAKNNQIYGTTQIERLSAMREAQGVFRESGLSGSAALAGAKLAAPVLAKLDFLASSLDDESKARMHTSNLSMLRYVESSGGLKSPQAFNAIADFGYKLNVSSGGQVNWEQLRQLKARAGAAGFHLTNDALARLEPIIAELKGGAVGFGQSTAFNRLTGATRVPNQIAHELVDYGVWDKDAVIFNRNGGIKQFTRPGGPMSKDKLDLYLTNPELFYESYIKPMYTNMKLDSAEIARQNVMLFNGTGGRLFTFIDNAMDRIRMSVSSMNKTSGIEEAYKFAENTPSGQEEEFRSAWKDFKTQWGTAILPFYSTVLRDGASILRSINASPISPSVPFKTPNAPAALIATIGQKIVHSLVTGVRELVHPPIKVDVDGRTLFMINQKYEAKANSAPQTGISSFDESMMLPDPGH